MGSNLTKNTFFLQKITQKWFYIRNLEFNCQCSEIVAKSLPVFILGTENVVGVGGNSISGLIYAYHKSIYTYKKLIYTYQKFIYTYQKLIYAYLKLIYAY